MFFILIRRLLPALCCLATTASAALIDVWRADDLNLNDSDIVGTWTSASNRTANAALGDRPTFRRNITSGGTSAVRFNRHFMTAPSPVGGRTAFSIACVFQATAVGANGNAQWYGKSGIIDAEQGGVVADWGTVIDQNGQVGIGTGAGDVSTYSAGASLVDPNYHVAVFTWGGGAQSVYVDNRPPITQAGVSAAARNNAGMAFGGILTGEGGTTRRFVGDLAEIRFYDTALTALQASNVINELRDTHILGNIPRVFSFAANPNSIYLGQSATLSWNISNATSVVIDQGIGAVALIGNASVSPAATTTYTLTATNDNGQRSASFTLTVDPGVPAALSITTNVAQGSTLALTLQGTDPNGGTLTYAIVDPPTHGSLSGTPPNVTYTPTPGYFGFDAFTFKVNDGAFDSAPATVSIKVVPPPAAPTAIVLSSTNFPATAGPGAFIAALRAVDVNEDDTHTFTLVPGLGNNPMFTANGNQLLASPAFTGGSGVTRTVRLRATDNAGLWVEQTFTLTSVETSQGIVVNEIHYNSPNNTIREEFIELYNPTDASVDISNWRIRGGVDYFFPANTSISARGFAIVSEHPATIATRYGVAAFGPWDGGINNNGEEITLRNALNEVVDVVDFQPEFPWPIAPDGEGASMQLVNASLDNDLGSSWRSGTPPTPGATNLVFATNAAPNIRQVNHSPEQPASTDSVVITCKVSDPEGVASVSLSYQIVNPGNFIPSRLPFTGSQLNTTNPNLTNALNPAFEAPANWTTITMTDADGDSVYTATLPQRAHRTLVRYRITVTDSLGASRRAPFEDDPSLNFAYFVYDAVPAYQGFSPTVLESLPVYTLITRDVDMSQCAAWFAPFNNTIDQLPQNSTGGARNEGRLHFNWEGALVYDGVVYDHVTYRLRGANGRYHNGKRSFRIRFKDGKLLETKDQYGRRFPTKWRELTTGKGQSNRGGESFALNEVVNYFLWNKVGVPAPLTFHFHFRVIRGAQETPADRYAGDFWGINWAQEKYDANFLEAHGLPKGNLYKLVDNFVLGLDELRYQAAFAPTNAADFFNIENTLNGFQSREWLEANANYTNWYRYHTIAEAIRHYDIWPSANKNGSWYFEPIYTAANNFLGRMMQLPYDGTDTWGPTWNGGEDVLYNGIFATVATGGDGGQNLEMQKEYRNTVREIRDLLFQPDQINAIIDAFATPLIPFAQADFARWAAAPVPSGYNSLGIPSSPGAVSGLPAYAQDMKNFMFVGGNNAWWIDRQSIGAGGWVTRLDQIAGADTSVPTRPAITYAGPSGFPADALALQSSAFADPEGNNTFGAMQWRVAQVLGFGEAAANPNELRLEWDAAWDSGELASFNEFITLPGALIEPERLYRARVRHKDNTGRWSRWSAPLEFRPRAADIVTLLRENLVIAEIMYNPPGADGVDGDEFEFLELKNIGATTLDLTALSFTVGINFGFTNGTKIAPGAIFLLARNPAQLATRYPGVAVNGAYTGRLDNGGETLTISHLHAGEILSVAYDDRAPWAVAADGFGFSLVFANGVYAAGNASPGLNAPPTTIGGVVINEVLSSSTLPLSDYIELYNITSASIDISGWYLTDDPTFPWKYRIPDGTMLAAGAYLVFDETHFNPEPGVGVSFSLSSFGDDVYVFSSSALGQLSGYSHGFEFGAAQDGVSFGRYVNSVGAEQFPLQVSRTENAANSGPRFGPAVISEIHYHPRNPADEFLEVHNPTPDSIAPTNVWQIAGLNYTFPQPIGIGPFGYLLLVADEPSTLRARWNVPASVEILQYLGVLQDSGENLQLQVPDQPAPEGVPYYAVDAVRYNDRRPWPLAADGGGASLHRLNALAYGDDPVNWAAARPTPGSPRIGGTTPNIVTQPQPAVRTNAVGGLASFSVNAGGPGPLFYQWRFNSDNIDDATNDTLLLQNIQLEDSGRYSVVVFNGAGSAESSNATLVVRVGVSITAHPTNALVRIPPDPQAAPATNAVFSVAAITFNPPMQFQWQFKGVNIPGATSNSLTVSNVTLANEGVYTAAVTDQIGSVPSAAVFLYPLITPRLVLNPITQSALAGQVISVSAEATGNPLPFGWEWRRISTSLASNAVNERFSFHNFVNTNVPGSTILYRVVARNLAGTANVAFNIVTLMDGDSDGLPDSFETAYPDAADPTLDADFDGLSNLQEYQAGTNPTNAASLLKLNLSAGGLLSFDASSNKTYTIQQTEALGAPWSKLTDFFARTNNRIETFLDPITPSNRVYRAVTPRQP